MRVSVPDLFTSRQRASGKPPTIARQAATPATTPVADKPLLRGWSHAIAVVAAVAATVALSWASRDDLPRLLSLLAYGLSLSALFATSALYHIGTWPGRWRTTLRAIDHANIFFVIAGTYTPICVNVLSGPLRVFMLATIWIVAAAGSIASVGTLRLPRWLSVGLYVGAGWLALIPAPSLVRLLPSGAIALLLGGGLLYTVGAVVYARRRPDPFPRTFGYHEVFHLCVIGGSAAFLTVIWIWVLPFPRS